MPIPRSTISPDLKSQVIVLWTVVYDRDPNCAYSFFSWQQVLNAIEGSLLTYLDDDENPQANELVQILVSKLADADMMAIIPIQINMSNDKQFAVSIFRWEIDATTPLFRVLSKCYEQVDVTTKADIMALLSDPR